MSNRASAKRSAYRTQSFAATFFQPSIDLISPAASVLISRLAAGLNAPLRCSSICSLPTRVKVTANPFQVIYDPTLFSTPPDYYTSAVNMVTIDGIR